MPMFGAFKKIFSKPTEVKSEAGFKTAPRPSVSPAPAKASQRLPHTPVAPVAKTSGNVISLPLKVLPNGASLSTTGEIGIPLEIILSQLSRGFVKMSIGQLREISPDHFTRSSEATENLVELPLSEIIPRIPVSHFTRRLNQKRNDPAPEIGDIFGPRGKTLNPLPPAAPTEKKSPEIAAVVATPAPAQTIPVAPISSPAVQELKAALETSEKIPSRLIPQQAAEGGISFALAEIETNWPQGIRAEITQANLKNSALSLPLDELEKSLRKGKAVFPWKQIAGSLQPPLASIDAANAETLLELPLKIIVPKFLAQKKPALPQKKISIPENIPDLFKQPGAAKIEVPSPTPAPVFTPDIATSVPIPMIPMSSPVAAVSNATRPKDILQKICAMEGILGAVITGQDGLLMAGQVSAPLQAEKIAAFLPQIFSRVNQPLSEMGKNEAAAFTIHYDDNCWRIVKVKAFYLLAISQPCASLPVAELKQLATELAKMEMN